ncbi:UNVERIFIED_CONTAM: Beta-glucosidase 40 [Sesamum radiatum]|uniref:Beta-glucosidase 40 n=1 Tax=Sesamum radiatum TaxID=300843 RepID=A0AAW2MYA6_SESRA
MCVVGVGIPTCCAQNISRGSFPKGFVFGTASSAFQGDVQLMKDMGMDAYRFSIAWSRIYPNGTGAINQAGINHYNKLIDALLANGIQPYVTLYHWDLPQSLEDGYNGWLSPQSIKDFATYAETCFKAFGDRVKYWITFNEPHTFAVQGYDVGLQAPGRCSILLRTFCRAGNSATEPYIVAHNVLLSHATVVNIYKWKYQPKQRGSIGITLDSFWYEPATNTSADIQAAERAIDFNLESNGTALDTDTHDQTSFVQRSYRRFIEPLIYGDYPRSMRTRVGTRLPKFSQAQAAQVKGAFDFIGINHYTTWYANENNTNVIGVLLNDSLADSGAFTLRMDDENSPFVSIKNALKDEKRIKYHNDYLTSLLAAIKYVRASTSLVFNTLNLVILLPTQVCRCLSIDTRREDGCNVRGYFVWSLLDNWEWGAGFSSRFGLYYVDYKDNLKRYAKDSVTWFKNFLAS